MTTTTPIVFFDGEMMIEKDVPIPLSDGHVLYCNVFRPKNADRKAPPILSFTPYGKDSDVAVDFKRYWDFVLRDHPEVVQGDSDGRYLTWEVPEPERWVPDGYAIVVVDARGTGKSPGLYEMMSPLQTRDFYDAIEWAGQRRTDFCGRGSRSSWARRAARCISSHPISYPVARRSIISPVSPDAA